MIVRKVCYIVAAKRLYDQVATHIRGWENRSSAKRIVYIYIYDGTVGRRGQIEGACQSKSNVLAIGNY